LSSNVRIISDEPWIIQTLRKYKLLKFIPDGLRTAVYDFLEDVGRYVRRRDVLVEAVGSVIIELGKYSVLTIIANIAPETFIARVIKKAYGL
jgi:hypothetical protein